MSSTETNHDFGYTLPPRTDGLRLRHAPQDDAELGPLREPEIFETEHHVYTTPFRYANVVLDGWYEAEIKGVEVLADRGSITIAEEKPIVSVTIVGSGCSGMNYNICEWWGPGETLRDGSTRTPQLIKRQRVDNLKGQHDAWVQQALSQEPDFQTLDDARSFVRRLQDTVYNMTCAYTVPGSIMTGLYENTAVFRIGDTSRPEHVPHRVVIRGGGLDYEDPGTDVSRYPADYTFRLVDVLVRK